ncbi:MAG: hypothetical protein ABIA04_12735 [Pseudomonadota bacterium]
MFSFEFELIEKKDYAEFYLLKFRAELSEKLDAIFIPGQFTMFADASISENRILNRPFSIYSWELINDFLYISLVIKPVGLKSKKICQSKIGTKSKMILPLGNGFRSNYIDSIKILISGGYGFVPLKSIYELTVSDDLLWLHGSKTHKENIAVKKILGNEIKISFASEEDNGQLVTDLLSDILPLLKDKKVEMFSCGPSAMFKAVYEIVKAKENINTYFSYETIMACGLGICLGCAVEIHKPKCCCGKEEGFSTYKMVCSDGPVFSGEELFGA